MLRSHFPFQAGRFDFLQFVPVVENQVGEGDEAFLTDYPKQILLSQDLDLVPWMVGFTSKDGGLFAGVVPHLFRDISQAGETRLLHQIRLIIQNLSNQCTMF
jgi:hypothetical protein